MSRQLDELREWMSTLETKGDRLFERREAERSQETPETPRESA